MIKNFGNAASDPDPKDVSDRAIGSQGGGSTTEDAGFEWRIKNTSGSPMTQFSVRYTGEQWRRHTVCPTDRSASQSVSLAYAISPPLASDSTPPSNLHFTLLGPEFQFTAPQTGGLPHVTVYPSVTAVVGAVTSTNYTVNPNPVDPTSTHALTCVGGNLASSGTTNDGFLFVRGQCDCTGSSLVARVDTFAPTTGTAHRAGLMFRQNSTDLRGKYVAISLRNNGEVRVVKRTTLNGAPGATTPSLAASGVTFPCWLRLVRSCDSFTPAYAPNNDMGTPANPTDDQPGGWVNGSTESFSGLDEPYQAGLFCAENATATFSHVAVSQSEPEAINGNLPENRKSSIGGTVVLGQPVEGTSSGSFSSVTAASAPNAGKAQLAVSGTEGAGDLAPNQFVSIASISGSTAYNGLKKILAVTPTTLVVDATYGASAAGTFGCGSLSWTRAGSLRAGPQPWCKCPGLKRAAAGR